MKTLMNKIRAALTSNDIARDDRGLSTVEYVIILVLIAVVAIFSWSKFGEAVTKKIDTSTEEIGKLGGKNTTD
jgi:Flp pilus assembly pilin Flp